MLLALVGVVEEQQNVLMEVPAVAQTSMLNDAVHKKIIKLSSVLLSMKHDQ